MNEAFELIKERLEESSMVTFYFDGKPPKQCVPIEDALEIVSEVEADFGKDINVRGNGWIPVEKALPENGQRVLTVSIPNIETHQINIEYYRKHYRHWRNGVILAWMPLPEPYKPEKGAK